MKVRDFACHVMYALFLGSIVAIAPAAADTAATDGLDNIWSSAKLYDNENNPHVQAFSLIGRYHGQFWKAESGDNEADDWENRRFYLGFKARLYRQFTFESQISVSEDFDPFYDGLYVTNLKWENSGETFSITGGRLDYVYTGLERTTSSKRINTIERALLVNQVMPGEVVGLYAKSNVNDASWHGGLFSGDIGDEFSDFDGGIAALAGYSTDMPLLYEEGTVHLDYLYNDGDDRNNAFRDYEHIVSFWHEGKAGRLGIGIDLTAATGLDDVSDVFGFTVLPTWDLAAEWLVAGDLLQLATRYHYASSDDEQGLSFARRYEREVASGNGDSYHSLYLGLNYLLYGHKLKFVAGAEYFEMSGVVDDAGRIQGSVDGWTYSAGLRLYF